MSQVDIVVTTYRNADKLKTCLNTVIEKTKHVEYKIYLWANDPNDEMKEVIHNSMFVDDIMFTDRIEPIYNDNNDGSFSSNNNEAAAEGDGEYILFLNDDCFPINDTWLLNMANVLDTNPKAGVVGALLLYPDKQTIQHCGVFFSHRTNNLPFHMLYKQSANSVANFISKPRYYQAVTGACMLVRRSDFEKIGGFDTGFYYCFEDVGLCLSMKNKLKKTCVYCPSAQLIHNEGISKTQPRLQENVKHLREKYAGQYFNDYEFYMNDPNFMVYKDRVVSV